MKIRQFIPENNIFFLGFIPTSQIKKSEEIEKIILQRLAGWATMEGVEGDEVVGMVARGSQPDQGDLESNFQGPHRLLTVPTGPGLYVHVNDLCATLSRIMKVDVSSKTVMDYIDKGVITVRPPARPEAN